MTDRSFDDIYRGMMASRADAVAKALDPEGHPKGPDMPSDYRPIRKSAADCPDVGRSIRTVAMMKSAMDGSSKPDAVSSVNGSPSRPSLESIRKSAAEPSRPQMLSSTTDLRKAVEQDWIEYNSFISNSE
jgi:hypothetical protein